MSGNQYMSATREKALGLVCVHGVGITRYCDTCAAVQGIMTREDQAIWRAVSFEDERDMWRAGHAADVALLKSNFSWGDLGSVRSRDGRESLASIGLTTDEARAAGLFNI